MLSALQLIAIAATVAAVLRACELRRERTRPFWFATATAALALGVVLLLAASDLVCAKILGLIVLPAGLVWLLLAGATLFAWRRSQRAAAAALGALFLFDTFAGNIYCGSALLALLERGLPHPDAAQLASFDAVCILGGGTLADADGVGELGDGGDRLAVAAALYHAGKTPLLVISGTRIASVSTGELDLSEESAVILHGLGVPEAHLVRLPPGPQNTAQELGAYRLLIAERGWHRVGVVSSAWHLPRAMRLCARIGLELVPLAADHRNRLPALSAYYLVPQEEGFAKVHHACWELLGCLLVR